MNSLSHEFDTKNTMKTAVKKAFQEIADSVPLPVYQKLVRRGVVSLFYHLVDDQPVAHARHLYPHRPTPLFEQDLIYLKENHNLISYEHLARRAAGKTKLPPKAVFLSFDDGFAECFTVVRPLLLEHRLPCTFFVVADLIDNRKMYYRNQVSLCIDRLYALEAAELSAALAALSAAFGVNLGSALAFVRWIKNLTDDTVIARACETLGVEVAAYLNTQKPYLTSEQIRVMDAEGFTIGAHGRSHRKLRGLSAAQIEAEIVGSCQVVRDLLGKSPVPFSFPNSATGVDRRLLKNLLLDHPFIGLLFDTKGLRKGEKYLFNRLWVESPLYNPEGKNSLQRVLLRAYQNHLLEGVRGRWQA